MKSTLNHFHLSSIQFFVTPLGFHNNMEWRCSIELRIAWNCLLIVMLEGVTGLLIILFFISCGIICKNMAIISFTSMFLEDLSFSCIFTKWHNLWKALLTIRIFSIVAKSLSNIILPKFIDLIYCLPTNSCSHPNLKLDWFLNMRILIKCKMRHMYSILIWKLKTLNNCKCFDLGNQAITANNNTEN